jgi:hypothetical protein
LKNSNIERLQESGGTRVAAALWKGAREGKTAGGGARLGQYDSIVNLSFALI